MAVGNIPTTKDCGPFSLTDVVQPFERLTVSEDASQLADLPEGVLSNIVSLLGVQDLPAIAVQSKKFRELTEEQDTWKDAYLSCWGPCDEEQRFTLVLVDRDGQPLPDTPSVWRSAFRTRIILPHKLVLACEAAIRAQQCARSSNSQASYACPAGKRIDFRQAYELTMRAAFEVGLAAEQDPKVHKNSLVRDFEESLQWWLHTRPEMVIAFVRDAESDLGQYDMWQMAFIHWPTIPWKRSALAYLPGLVAKVSQAWEHISVLRALDREVKVLDNTIKSLENQGDTLSMVAPVGAPKKHWWWWLQ